MAKYSSRRSKTIFIKHHGAEQRSVYFHVNPQALRVQQGNKGSVVDTLGGYFREIMYAKDAQYSGLMLPDLTIECDTGRQYREELKKFEWIWRHHGDRKPDGTPADTFLMDFADDSVGWMDGGIAGGGMPGMSNHISNMGSNTLNQPDVTGVHQSAYTIKGLLNNQSLGTMGQALRDNGSGTRFLPRVFKIEILNFAWDETVQDPFRIRFNFRCKVLRDMLWKTEQQENQRTGRTMFSLAQAEGGWTDKQVASFGDSVSGGGNMAGLSSGDFPLNLPAQGASIQRTLDGLDGIPGLSSGFTQPVSGGLSDILGQAGLGQNNVAQKIMDLGRGVFDNANLPIYPGGSQGGLLDINTMLSDVIGNLPEITTGGPQSLLQAVGWEIPQIPDLTGLIDFKLPDLSFFEGLLQQAIGGVGMPGAAPGATQDRSESAAYPSTKYGEISL